MKNIDIDLLERYKSSNLTLLPNCFTNWIGLKTDASMFPNAKDISGKVFPDIPTGGDGIYGGYYEYASFLTAIDRTPSRKIFNAVELGAGWGPWIAGVGIVCHKLGFDEINLIGVEADEEKCNLMAEHMARNELHAQIVKGAAWSSDTTLKFPKIHRQDHDGAAAMGLLDGSVDYRGLPQQYIDVPAYSISTICQDLGVIDYMHWDIQGAEYDVLSSAAEFINDRVRFLFIGTHSRPIEGKLIEHFYKNKWDVLIQNPCNFVYDKTKPTIEGMTTSDGEIFALNPRFL